MSIPTSFRLTGSCLNLISLLSKTLGLHRSAVIETAIRELAEKHKITKIEV
jgi:hypothetical protein